MKPTKSASNKKHLKEKEAPKIQTYFKSTSKSFVINDNDECNNNVDHTKKFYVDALKQKLKDIAEGGSKNDKLSHQDEVDNASDNACAVVMVMESESCSKDTQVNSEGHDSQNLTHCAGCIQKATEIDELRKKYKSSKQNYAKVSIEFSELTLKYNDLLKVATSANRQRVDDAATSSVNVSVNVFTPNEVKFIQCMSLDKSNDCSFIRHCLKYAYKSDPAVLVLKTLKGTPEWVEFTDKGDIIHSAKTPLTPEKVERIKALFTKRISKCKIDPAAYGERIKDSYVNKFIAAGIKSISKKYK